jgi:replicative DNA helicase
MDALVSGAVVEKEVGLKSDAVAGVPAESSGPEPAKPVMHRSSDIATEYLESLAKRCNGEINYVNSGFESLDDSFPAFLSGGHLIVIAARPGMGKTSLAQQILENVAAKGRTVMFLSLEMSAHELGERSIARRSGVSMKNLKTGKISEEEWEKVTAAAQEFAALPILVNDYGSDLKTLTKNITKDAKDLAGFGLPPLGLIVLDYLQLTSAKGSNKNEEIGEVSGGMKRLARQLDVPIIALSQLSRKCEQRQDKRPVMSDLRDSGKIEQDADLIAMIYRDEVYNPDTADHGVAEFLAQKNRHGAGGMVRLSWRGERFAFGDAP